MIAFFKQRFFNKERAKKWPGTVKKVIVLKPRKWQFFNKNGPKNGQIVPLNCPNSNFVYIYYDAMFKEDYWDEVILQKLKKYKSIK